VKRVTDQRLLDWVDGRAPDGHISTGYDATGWETSIWVLHAMYETEHMPDGVTHDDVDRAERAAHSLPPTMIGALDVGAVLDATTATGVPLGRSAWPGRGWQRLRWTELARRLQVDPFAVDVAPGTRSFPYSSWPVNVRPPAEGSLDREQFLRLVDLLAASTPARNVRCVAFYAPCAVGQYEELVIYEGTLNQVVHLYDDDDLPGAPSNLWPDERSWFVYTDCDSWATKVSGSAELIGALSTDSQLETVALDF